MSTEAQICANRPNAIRYMLYAVRYPLYAMRCTLYAVLNMQNKPNLVRRRRIANELKVL